METGLQPRKKAPAADFSLAIINVVFLLLFFFILTGNIVQRVEMEVRPPNTSRLPLERLPRPLIVVSDQGTLLLDGVAIAEDALLEKIKKSRARKVNEFKTLNILADSNFPAKAFLSLIEPLRRTGLPIRIVTVRDKKGE
jgi:biopolymer transport protein ExbD